MFIFSQDGEVDRRFLGEDEDCRASRDWNVSILSSVVLDVVISKTDLNLLIRINLVMTRPNALKFSVCLVSCFRNEGHV